MVRILIGGFALALTACAPTVAGSGPVATPAVIAPAERAVIQSAIDGVYAVISGPPGAPRDWAKMRTLFTPDARLVAITRNGLRGGGVDDFIRDSGPGITKSGFVERELSNRMEVYGGLAHVWSSYSGTSGDGKIHVRGINSFQLHRQADGRWKVFTIYWQAENPALPLPADMTR